MSNRITLKQLEAVVSRINRVTDSPERPYIDGNAQVGNYHISQAYGGCSLHRMCNEHGGIRDVFNCGHVPKRELYGMLHAYIVGLEFD